MKPKKIKYKEWTLIDWDGNPELGFKCWRKSFGRSHVSVGAGEFLIVCFSFGANSDDSHSGTRWDYDHPPISEQEMMKEIDEEWARRKTGPSNRKLTTPKHLYNRPAKTES